MSKKTKYTQSKKTASSGKAKPGTPGNLRWFMISIVAALVVLGVVVALILINLPGTQEIKLENLPDEINVGQAYDLYQQGVFLLDVRTQGEWDETHVPNATLIPLDELESRLSEVPSDQEIVVMCRSGNRSQIGRDLLRKAGFENVTSMAGGINDWRAAGYPTEP